MLKNMQSLQCSGFSLHPFSCFPILDHLSQGWSAPDQSQQGALDKSIPTLRISPVLYKHWSREALALLKLLPFISRGETHSPPFTWLLDVTGDIPAIIIMSVKCHFMVISSSFTYKENLLLWKGQMTWWQICSPLIWTLPPGLCICAIYSSLALGDPIRLWSFWKYRTKHVCGIQSQTGNVT